MNSKAVIVWFRNDLRLQDNPALISAIKSNLPIIPIFIFDSTEEDPWALGAASKLWLHHSLKSLASDLEKLGLKLFLFRGNSLKILKTINQRISIAKIFINRLYEPIQTSQDQKIIEELTQLNIEFEIHNGSLIFDPDLIKNKQGGVFKVFTPYYNHCLAILEKKSQDLYNLKLCDQETLKASLKLNSELLNYDQNVLDSLHLVELRLLVPDTEWQNQWQEKMLRYFEIGESAARINLENFVSSAAEDYSVLRDRPDLPNTSKLSCYLHFGEISPVRILIEAKNFPAYSRQIIWREFAFYVMHHFPFSTDQNLKKDFDNFPWLNDQSKLQAWQRGLTGYPIVDAGMRELWETGWMHNRVRMIVGSFLVKDLLIHWHEGAKWFWDTLFDADLANNSMGWQWVAGSGVDASPYFRIFNPTTQAEKFDPEGNYIRQWIPELKALSNEWIHKPFAAPALVLEAAGIKLGEHYPLPIVNHDAARKQALTIYKTLKVV